jgi:hypothetical protein
VKIRNSSVLIAMIVLLGFQLQAQAASITLTTDDGNGADAFVLANNANSNFGNDSAIRVKNAPGTFNRKGYFRFDLSAVGAAPLTDATLTLIIGNSGTGTAVTGTQTFSVYGLLNGNPGETWGESTITWNNAPANDTSSGSGVLATASLLGQFSFTGNGIAGTPVTLSGTALDNFLNADTNDLATFILVRTTFDPNAGGWVHNFAAQEHTSLAPPTLDVTVVPLPATAWLMSSGLLTLWGLRRFYRPNRLHVLSGTEPPRID